MLPGKETVTQECATAELNMCVTSENGQENISFHFLTFTLLVLVYQEIFVTV